MPNSLEQLKKHTVVVADTGDFETIAEFKPTDATTNPSLVYAAAQLPAYQKLVKEVIDGVVKEKDADMDANVEKTLDRLVVRFGTEILKIVPGRVSTEVDARLSFDTAATVAKAKELIALYAKEGVAKERILIKIASTWEGICAGKVLEKEYGIHVNMTLLFGYHQAIAAAQAGVTLVSPFVGRILDWHKKADGVDGYAPDADPGVLSVSKIYKYYKKFGHETIVMGASFRNKEEIAELCGCDYLTIAPKFLKQFKDGDFNVPEKLNAERAAKDADVVEVKVDEGVFRWELNQDAMATEKLAEGIRKFGIDLDKLRVFLRNKLQEAM